MNYFEDVSPVIWVASINMLIAYWKNYEINENICNQCNVFEDTVNLDILLFSYAIFACYKVYAISDAAIVISPPH